jgi:hypothetical protein
MSWKNYKEKIVTEHQVILENWPSEKFDPGEMGMKELERAMKALEDGHCAWRKLTEAKFVARQAGHVPSTSKKRKARSDKGKARKAYKKTKRKAASDDSSSSDKDHGRCKGQPVSAETIESSDDE